MRRWWGALAVLFLCSCSEAFVGWSVIEGNAAYQRGEFQKASLAYLGARGQGAADDVIDYNLGNVYNALGETEAALAVWQRVNQPGSEELVYRLAFNKGYLFYQQGQYDRACQEFRTALLMKPSSLDAKRNLEICLLKNQSFGTTLPERTRSPGKNQLGEAQQALLDYVDRWEGNRWKANNRPEGSGPLSPDW